MMVGWEYRVVRVGVGESESIGQRVAKNEQNTASSASREARCQPRPFSSSAVSPSLSFPSPSPSRRMAKEA